jgi:hypothetical protein
VHARWADIQKALELLGETRQHCQEPDVIMYSAAISACEKGKYPERAFELFEENAAALSGVQCDHV